MRPHDDRHAPAHNGAGHGAHDGAHARATGLIAGGQIAVAERELRALLSRDPHDARALFLLGRAAAERKDFAAEMTLIRQAIDLAPTTAEFIAQLGRCHLRTGDAAAALACAAQAEADDAADDLTLDTVAAIHTALHRHVDAVRVLRRAVAGGSRNPAVLFNLATAEKFCGDFAGAEDALVQAIAVAPRFLKARTALSALRPATPERNQVGEYRAMLATEGNPVVRAHICQAAARECDALGRYDDAYALLADGKRGLLDGSGYDFAEDAAVFRAIRRGFSAPRAVTGHGGARPIFVVGMPRSGTTLVDRILSADPTVAPVGESLVLGAELRRAAGRTGAQLIDAASVRDLAMRDDLSDVGERYIAALQAHGGAGRRVLDKFHLNVLLAGFIARALPDARIVCVVRGAMDTVVGNFRQLFEYRSGLYRYSLSATTIARFYVEFHLLAEHWSATMPDRFRIVRYEDLVADPVAHGRAMAEFCQLDWRDGYARIEDNAAPVATASAVQVRQPINRDAIGHWRRYEAHLAEPKRIIAAAGLPL